MSKTLPTSVNKSDAKECKYYLIDGAKYATASNWRIMGQQPISKAVATLMTTKNGYEFNIYHESQTEKYDEKAHAKAIEKAREMKKLETEYFNRYRKHEISLSEYTEALAQLQTA